MSVVRRTALFSIVAASALVALKLGAGIAAGSLGLLAEAAHSATDLVAALLTFLAVRVGEQPPDEQHPFGHNKAEHLAALAEATVLLAASGLIIYEAITRLTSSGHAAPTVAWWTFAILAIVIIVDLTRMIASDRVAHSHGSAALHANALHFAGDLGGSIAVLLGLALVTFGYGNADSWAALVVAVLVIVAAVRLMRTNISVLMDSAPVGSDQAAREAIAALGNGIELRRLRLRGAGNRTFADVVIAVEPDTGLSAGHAVAESVEAAVREALGDSDVVVHVEPNESRASTRARASAAALTVPAIREVHNVELVRTDSSLELSLHLKLPRDLTLDEAHAAADEAEKAIRTAVPELDEVHSHIEPLADEFEGQAIAPGEAPKAAQAVRDAAIELTGQPPSSVVLRRTGRGLVAMITLNLDPSAPLTEAHAVATEVENRAIELAPELDEVVVHTEPVDGSPA
ncbi:MAG: cation diffusion facilitator family transporter [Actinomycetes bacterium]